MILNITPLKTNSGKIRVPTGSAERSPKLINDIGKAVEECTLKIKAGNNTSNVGISSVVCLELFPMNRTHQAMLKRLSRSHIENMDG